MTAAARRLRQWLDRRRTALLLLGLGKLGFGLGVVPTLSPDGLRLALRIAPISVWTWVWATAGLIAVTAALAPRIPDPVGYAAGLTPPVLWGASYLIDAATGVYPPGWGYTLWLATAHVGLIWWVASEPDPTVWEDGCG